MQRWIPFVLFLLPAASAQEPDPPAPEGTDAPSAEPARLEVDEAVARGVQRLLALPEGDAHDQWPYEGVYREDRGQLPVGYRIGGTAIVCLGLLSAPGLEADAERRDAIRLGIEYVLASLEHPRMQAGFVGTYDVRNWGHVYALLLCDAARNCDAVGEALKERTAAKIPWLAQVLAEMALPKGGWAYSHQGGYRSERASASPFLTGPALQALFAARRAGVEIDEEVIERALDALERARSAEGGYAYSAPSEALGDTGGEALSMMDKTPGSVARSACVETTLKLAGRGDDVRLERAVARFFEHWDALAVRRAKTGTHLPPYGVAPYYFLYGHLYAAQAIEQLPDAERREEYRERMREVLARTRAEDGSWNDRHFPRSAGYGTACAVLALLQPRLAPPARLQN